MKWKKIEKMKSWKPREESIKTGESSQLHAHRRVTEQGEYREVPLGFCDMETNKQEQFQKLGGDGCSTGVDREGKE